MAKALREWEMKNAPSIPGTYLHHVSPHRVGSQYVEGFTSVLARLSESHSQQLSHLFTRILFPRAGVKLPLTTAHYSTELLVMTEETQKLIDVVQELCGLSNLCQTVISPESGIPLHSRKRRWCPDCYRDEPYDRLVWSFAFVEFCTVHRQPLVMNCRHCKQEQPPSSVPLTLCHSCKCTLRYHARFDRGHKGVTDEEDQKGYELAHAAAKIANATVSQLGKHGGASQRLLPFELYKPEGQPVRNDREIGIMSFYSLLLNTWFKQPMFQRKNVFSQLSLSPEFCDELRSLTWEAFTKGWNQPLSEYLQRKRNEDMTYWESVPEQEKFS